MNGFIAACSLICGESGRKRAISLNCESGYERKPIAQYAIRACVRTLTSRLELHFTFLVSLSGISKVSVCMILDCCSHTTNPHRQNSFPVSNLGLNFISLSTPAPTHSDLSVCKNSLSLSTSSF